MLEKLTRRNFLRIVGLGGTGLAAGCVTSPKVVNLASVSDSEFLQKFDEWYIENALYNGINPNIVGRTGVGASFKKSADLGATPGQDYYSNKMYAVACGTVRVIDSIPTAWTGRLGGMVVSIDHPKRPAKDDKSITTFVSYYAHLGDIFVQEGQDVERGQLIADVMSTSHAKLFVYKYGFIEETYKGNLVDADNYGVNHGYMNYPGAQIDCEGAYAKKRWEKQLEILKTVCSYLSPETGLSLDSLGHRKHPYRSQVTRCYWDEVEIIRYLDKLFEARPQYFPKLTPEKFAEHKKEFYANQPIVFTLPIKP
jgi:hypothetical protein